jgi:hypothetical protein
MIGDSIITILSYNTQELGKAIHPTGIKAKGG